MTIKKMLLTSAKFQLAGQALLTSSQSWTVPDGVYSISVLVVNPGLAGNAGTGNRGPGGTGGAGGASRYINNFAVTPGQVISATFGPAVTSFGTIISGSSGGIAGLNGEQGSSGVGGGVNSIGGAGGSGGRAISLTNPDLYAFGSGGGVSGSSSAPGAGGAGAFPGGGGGGGGGAGASSSNGAEGGAGGAGAIQILWPGGFRQFPGTRTGLEIVGELNWSLIAPPDLSSVVDVPTALATDGQGIWVVFPSGIQTFHYRSTDNGKTFSKVTRSTSYNVDGIVYAGGVFVTTTRSGVVLRSTDGGLTFSTVAIISARCIAFNSGRILLGGASSSGSTDGLAYSDDYGLTWKKSTIYQGDTNFSDLVYGNGIWWALSSTGYAQRSSDNGVTFVRDAGALNFDNGVYAGGKFIVTKASTLPIVTNSTGAAGAWVTGSSNTGTGANVAISNLGDRLILSGNGKLLESFDYGTNWSDQKTISNNIAYTTRIMGKIVGDGLGVYVALGNAGLLMRADRK